MTVFMPIPMYNVYLKCHLKWPTTINLKFSLSKGAYLCFSCAFAASYIIHLASWGLAFRKRVVFMSGYEALMIHIPFAIIWSGIKLFVVFRMSF